MLESKLERQAKRMRLAVRILAGILAAISLVALSETFRTPKLDNLVDSTAVALMGIIHAAAIVGAALSWWRLRLAGIILVLVAAAMAIFTAVYDGSSNFTYQLMAGSPYLVVAGVLFLNSWWLSRKIV